MSCFNKIKLTMEMKWMSMARRWWVTNNTIRCRSRSQRRILFKIKSKRLFKFVLIMMLCLEIQSSLPMILLSTMILQIHLNMPWTCQQLNGKDLKKLLQKESLSCLVMRWLQEISSKESWEIAGSLDLYWFRAQIQNFWKILLSTMVSNTVLQFSNSSKMVAGNMWSWTLEFLTILKARPHYMVIALTITNSGFP